RGDRAAAALSAAATILVPGLGVSFASINNDQFAILFPTAAIVVILRGLRIGVLSPRRTAVASVLSACGLLAKGTAIGPFVGAAVLVTFGAAEAGRFRRFLLFAIPGLAALLWWPLRYYLLTGHLNPLTWAIARWPLLSRVTAPDWSERMGALGSLLVACAAAIRHANLPPNRPLQIA